MIQLYITPKCSHVQHVISSLQMLGVSYQTIDIDQDADAGQRLLDQTGDLVVPTLELEDGTFLQRPSIEKLRELFAPQEAVESAKQREQAQLLAQNQHRLAGMAAWGRYLNLVALGCGLFWLGGLNPLGINPAQSFWWLIGASLLLLVVTLADKFGLLKGLGPGLKKALFYGLFFCMAYLMGLSFVTSQGMIQKQSPQFTPLPVVTALFSLGAGLWAASLLLQVLKRLWIERLTVMQRVRFVLGILSLLGFAISLYLVWKNKGPMPIELTWFMLFVLTLTLLVNLAFAVARMRTQSAIEKAGPVLYPAFAALSLLVMLLVH
jgi:arsenate reductase-like glutaredoxin family protein